MFTLKINQRHPSRTREGLCRWVSGRGAPGPGRSCPTAGGWGAFGATSVAPGSWKREEDRAAKPGPDPGSRRAWRALDKGVFILATNKATVAVTFILCWLWRPLLCPAGSSHFQQILSRFGDVMNTSGQAACVLPGACFSHPLFPEDSGPSRRPVPVAPLSKKPLEAAALDICL